MDGERPGSVNRFTGTFRDAVQTVYNGLGGHGAFQKWAKSNRTEYYRIASKLIPLEIKGSVKDQITVIVQRATPQPIALNPKLEPYPRGMTSRTMMTPPNHVADLAKIIVDGTGKAGA